MAAPAYFHNRIKKAVTKEYYSDWDFKESQAALGKRCWVRKESAEDTILFTLKSTLGFADFGIDMADIAALDFAEIDFDLMELLK